MMDISIIIKIRCLTVVKRSVWRFTVDVSRAYGAGLSDKA